MSRARSDRSARLSVTSARPAEPRDLPRLREIEQAADHRFADVFGAAPDWPEPPTGAARAGQPGFLVVVGQPAVGFAHVLELRPGRAGHAHLEQLAVHPDAGGRGLGTMLLVGAMGEALDRGHEQLTLSTFADVPWNGPWYARHGFTELVTDLPGHAPLLHELAQVVAAESRLGLGRYGRRALMARRLTDEPEPMPAVSVIPLRDGPRGLEAFVQHRAATMDFVPGMVVFPGGRVDPQDVAAGDALDLPAGLAAQHAARWRHTGYAGAASPRREQRARTLLATGVRELAEETGLFVAPQRLVPWDNWVTPAGHPKRFDVSFLALPIEQDALAHTTTEATDSEWLAVDELVRQSQDGPLAMVAPTRTIVDELQALGSVEAVLRLRPEIHAVRNDMTPTRPRPSATDPE